MDYADFFAEISSLVDLAWSGTCARPCYCLPECSGCTRLNGVRMASHLQSCQMHLNALHKQQACTGPPTLLFLMLKVMVDEVNLPCKTLRSSQDRRVLALLSEKENIPIIKKKPNKGSNHDRLKENTVHNNVTSWGGDLFLFFFLPVVEESEGCECRWLLA